MTDFYPLFGRGSLERTGVEDLRALDSATKYPSIETYHRLDATDGRLLPEHASLAGNITVTEKIDGTNARITVLPSGDWFIGERDGWLTAREDRVWPKTNGVVDTLRTLADQLAATPAPGDEIRTYYLEVYGGKIGQNHRQYTSRGEVSYRLFDVSILRGDDIGILNEPVEKISLWRQHGGQTFLAWSYLRLLGLPTVPVIGVWPAESVPVNLRATREWLDAITDHGFSRVTLDDDARGHSEGVVLRTADRGTIVKVRFQDYDRTLRSR